MCADWLLTMLTVCWLATHHVECVLIGYSPCCRPATRALA